MVVASFDDVCQSYVFVSGIFHVIRSIAFFISAFDVLSGFFKQIQVTVCLWVQFGSNATLQIWTISRVKIMFRRVFKKQRCLHKQAT